MIAEELLALVGRTVSLPIKRKVSAGYILDVTQIDLLLPTRLASADLAVDDMVTVFVYTDSDDRPVATMQKPLAQVGDFACLSVVDESRHGAFLDWGLDKDLFCPFAEQHQKMKIGERHVVAVYLDNPTGRVAATSRLAEFFDYDVSQVEPDQRVELLVYALQPRGAQVIVNDRYTGLIFSDQNFSRPKVGDRLIGYVDAIRTDNKLDIRLQETRASGPKERIFNAYDVVLQAMKQAGGTLPLGDKSEPDLVYDALGISKKSFKAAVGQLYKKGLAKPGPYSTELIKQQHEHEK